MNPYKHLNNGYLLKDISEYIPPEIYDNGCVHKDLQANRDTNMLICPMCRTKLFPVDAIALL